ncbi:MAG: hypothetical protein OEY94_00305 [Alphaproteobacteria bacterium]|nr:hypothetical protein [Alphaproteobacteria bacterium]
MSEFNEKSSGVSEEPVKEQPRFSYKPNPMVERAYQFFEYKDYKTELEHVGDYVLINKDEDREVTEKKVMNLVTLMNGKKDLIDLSNLTKIRVLFTIVPEAQAGEYKKVIFKDYDGSGVSKDNAVFTIRKGVFKDD